MIDSILVQVPHSKCGSDDYPQMFARWSYEAGGIGWTARVRFVPEKDALTCGHEIYLGVTSPISHLWLTLDSSAYSSVSHAKIPLCDLTQRDLVWATWWAFGEIKRLHEVATRERCLDRFAEWEADRAIAMLGSDAPRGAGEANKP